MRTAAAVVALAALLIARLVSQPGDNETGRRLVQWLCVAPHRDPSGDGINVADAKAADGSLVRIPDPLLIQLTGTDHRWRAVYPPIDADAAVIDDLRAERQLHVPLDTDIVLALSSTDYVYTLSLPEFDQKQIAVPGREFRISFHPRQTGTFALVGEELCGLAGSDDSGQFVVEPHRQFRDWLNRHKSRN